MAGYDLHRKAAAIVRDAGGKLVGRTRLQKIAYLSQLAGFSDDFPFEYRHYGPFSEELAEAMMIASGIRLVREDEDITDWGARYSIYRIDNDALEDMPFEEGRAEFVKEAARAGSIELELAATAAFLYSEEDVGDPWEETRNRKPEKAKGGGLAKARALYRKLQRMDTPEPLPPIA